MTRPVRVLQVLDSLGMGGAETWLMDVLRHWSHSGEGRMDFLLTGGRESVFDKEAAALGAGLHYMRFGRRTIGQFTRSYRRLLAEGDYDAIHDHADYAAGWKFLLGAGVLPRIRVAHVHNPWLHISANYAVSPTRRIAVKGGKRLVYRLATHVCGTSAMILRQYGFEPGSSGPPNVSVVHCGFDVRRFAGPAEPDRTRVLSEFGWPPDTKLILFAGRLDRGLRLHDVQNHKNSWLALTVAREALARDPSVRLIMAGTGDSLCDLRRNVSEWGLAHHFRLPGVRHDIANLMRAADVLLFPSAQEGLGMAAVEAQAAALPVLASDAVPREAVVIPDLFQTCALDEPISRWACMLLKLACLPRFAVSAVADAFDNSPFSVRVSADRLLQIYRNR